MFISFEGPEGGGKTTQIERLSAALRAEGRTVRVVREPGTTILGDYLRDVLLNTRTWQVPIGDRAEALLFAAARAQLVDEVLRPALERGEIVLADRFSDSTRAYQIAGRGLPAAAVGDLIDFATTGLEPDVTFLLDVGVEIGLARKDQRGDRLEREAVEFHRRVRSAYLSLARQHPARIVVLDATREPQDLAAQIHRHVADRLRAPQSGERAPESEPQEGESAS